MINFNNNSSDLIVKKWKKLQDYHAKLDIELKQTMELLKKNRITRENWYKNNRNFMNK